MFGKLPPVKVVRGYECNVCNRFEREKRRYSDCRAKNGLDGGCVIYSPEVIRYLKWRYKMTSKQAKEYLLRVRRAKREVQRYRALKARARRDLACSTTAPPDKLSSDRRRQGACSPRYAQYAATLDEKISEPTICKMRSPAPLPVCQIGSCCWVLSMTWEQTAYSYQNVAVPASRKHSRKSEIL